MLQRCLLWKRSCYNSFNKGTSIWLKASLGRSFVVRYSESCAKKYRTLRNKFQRSKHFETIHINIGYYNIVLSIYWVYSKDVHRTFMKYFMNMHTIACVAQLQNTPLSHVIHIPTRELPIWTRLDGGRIEFLIRCGKSSRSQGTPSIKQN